MRQPVADPFTYPQRRPIEAHAIRRRWLTIATITLLVGALAAVIAVGRSRTYTASTSVFVRPLPGNALTPDAVSTSQDTTVALNTEASLVDSAEVTDRVNAVLGTHLTPGSVAHGIAPADTQLVVIEAHGDSADVAKRYASAYASAFLDYRTSLARANQRQQVAQLNVQEAAAHARMERAAKAANAPHPAPDAAAELQLASAQLASIQTAIGEAEAMDTDPGSVARPAHVAAASLVTTPAAIIAAGVLLGLTLGFLLALWREYRDDRIRASEDAAIEGVPVLALVPRRQAAAAIRDVRTSLIAAAPSGAVLAITPLTSAESAVTAELALALAQSLGAAGYRVVLTDAVLRQPRVGALLEMTDDAGLSDRLVASGGHPEPIAVDGIRVLPAGLRTEPARERYGGQAMATLFAELRADTDYLLVVTAPVDSSDGPAVLRSVERIVLVATEKVSRRAQIRGAAQLAERLGRPLVGLIAVHARRRKRHRQRAPRLDGSHAVRDRAPAAQRLAVSDEQQAESELSARRTRRGTSEGSAR
jgi:Mrp family chromosome partitioning ATPase